MQCLKYALEWNKTLPGDDGKKCNSSFLAQKSQF